MFKELEDGVLNVIKNSALGPLLRSTKTFGAVKVKAIDDFALLAPGVVIGILDGKVEPVAQKFEVRPKLLVWCIAQDLGPQDGRRRKENVGAFALMHTVLELLWGKALIQDDSGTALQNGGYFKPGMTALTKRLTPEAIGSIQDEDLEKKGLAVYWIVFETGWTIQPPAEGAPLYIQRIGLDYFIEPGRDMTNPATPPDAEDLLIV